MKIWQKIIAITGVLAMFTGLFSSCTSAKTGEISQSKISYKTADEKQTKKLSDGKSSVAVKLEKGQELILDLDSQKSFDTIILDEKGDNANWFKISIFDGNAWKVVYEQDRILKHHTCYVEPVKAEKIKLEITDSNAPVEICEIQIYEGKKQQKDFRFTQYLVMDNNNITNALNLEADGFSGFYNVVTDINLIGVIQLNANCELVFSEGEEAFAKNLKSLKDVIGERDVKLWTTIFFDQKDEEGKKNHDKTAELVMNNIEKIKTTIKAFVEKYDLYGVDYDWEYPEKSKQWKAYDKIVIETSKVTRVAVALPTWGIKFSKEAIKCLDYVNVMTYDIFDERGDHCNSYIGGMDAIEKLRKAGFEDKQIFLGIPSYARTTNKSGSAWPVYSQYPELGKWGNKIKDYEYIENDEKKTCDAYLDSYAEVRDKTALAIDNGLGGVMMFRAMCDAPYTYKYSLHRAIEEVIENRIIENK